MSLKCINRELMKKRTTLNTQNPLRHFLACANGHKRRGSFCRSVLLSSGVISPASSGTGILCARLKALHTATSQHLLKPATALRGFHVRPRLDPCKSGEAPVLPVLAGAFTSTIACVPFAVFIFIECALKL